MSTKELALEAIRDLPETASWEDVEARIHFYAAIERGRSGTYIGFRYNSDRERTKRNAFLAVTLLAVITVHLAVVFLAPNEWKALSWIVYAIFLPLYVTFWSRQNFEGGGINSESLRSST